MKTLPLLSAALVLSGLTSDAADWPQWGGNDPGRNMYSPETRLPDRFAKEAMNAKIDFKPGTEEVDVKSAKNLKWVAKIGSQSYGNVTVAGGRVYIGTNNENPRDKQHQGDRSILMVFDEKTGDFLWQLVVPKLASGGESRSPFLPHCRGQSRLFGHQPLRSAVFGHRRNGQRQ